MDGPGLGGNGWAGFDASKATGPGLEPHHCSVADADPRCSSPLQPARDRLIHDYITSPNVAVNSELHLEAGAVATSFEGGPST